MYQKRQLDDAERLYLRALEVRERYYTRMSDRAGQTLHNLATLAKAKGEDAKAEELFVECLAIREQCFGPHADTIKTAAMLASIYREQKRKPEEHAIKRCPPPRRANPNPKPFPQPSALSLSL